MYSVIRTIRDLLRAAIKVPAIFDAEASWDRITKQTIARFSRGNISAQKGRILTIEAQKAERERAYARAKKWRGARTQ